MQGPVIADITLRMIPFDGGYQATAEINGEDVTWTGVSCEDALREVGQALDEHEVSRAERAYERRYEG